jgi:hypothetical protein
MHFSFSIGLRKINVKVMVTYNIISDKRVGHTKKKRQSEFRTPTSLRRDLLTIWAEALCMTVTEVQFKSLTNY